MYDSRREIRLYADILNKLYSKEKAKERKRMKPKEKKPQPPAVWEQIEDRTFRLKVKYGYLYRYDDGQNAALCFGPKSYYGL